MFADRVKTDGAEEMAQCESKRTELWKLTRVLSWLIHTVNLGRAAGSGREGSGLPRAAHLSYFPLCSRAELSPAFPTGSTC